MKTIRSGIALLAVSLTAFLGCNKTDLTKPRVQPQNLSASTNLSNANSICGEPVVYNLIDIHKVVQGTLTISNDETNVYITFDITKPDFKMSKAELVIGTLAHVTAATDINAWPKLAKGPNPPDFTKTFKPEVTSYTFTIPLADYEECFFVNAFAKLLERDANGNIIGVCYVFLQSDTHTSVKCWSAYIEYCKQHCEECGQLTTYTQGGYGNDNGNGTGTQYMIANFDAAFPSGVTIGCASGFTLKMTNAASIQTYLPSGSTPEVLTQNWVDDGPNDVLAGQMLTLALTIGFDNYDPNFGAATIHLEDMIIGSGDFQGMTVGQFFAIANDVLGGCSTAYTPAQINEAADKINNNYDEGKQDLGFLICPNGQ